MVSLRAWSTGIIALAFTALMGLMMTYPSEALQAALRGLSIWWDILFPALFPFFVISEMMLGFGVVHFFGTLLDPMMRPLFRVPGIGGFVMAMGFASGYPVGARLTAQLWEQRLVSRDEGERLVAFTTSSDPIFLIGAVSVGFFHDVSLAIILAMAHYGSGVLIGLLMRFHGRKPDRKTPVFTFGRGIVWRALQAMHVARIRDGRPLGTMFREAVQSSLNLILVIGGLVVFFCVVLEVFTLAHIMDGLYAVITSVLQRFRISPELSQSVVNGLFEVTLGAKSAAGAGEHLQLLNKVAIAAFVLSWGGLSVHAQIVSLLNRTNLRYAPFMAARLIHGLLAASFVYVIWQPLQPLRAAFQAVMPAFNMSGGTLPVLPWMYSTSILMFACILAMIICLFVMYSLGSPIIRALLRLVSRAQ